MTRTRSARRLAGAALAVAVLALPAGCALGTAGGAVPSAQLAGPLAGTPSLSGLKISVGSKNFSENILLAKMALILLKADGADVTDLSNIPGSVASRQAQLSGDIDAMWEYTGTAWLTYLQHDQPIKDEQQQYVAVRDEDEQQNQLDWLPPAPMNNTYAFAVTQQTADKYGLKDLSDISKVPVGQRTFCVESEFQNRSDGLEGMLKTYGVPLGAKDGVPGGNIQTYQTGAVYAATAAGDCTFGEVFTTDGRIVALHLTVLKDDKVYFPNYNVSFVVRQSVMDAYPAIAQLVDPLSEKLTNDVLLKLNAEIDVDGKEPADVAEAWLRSEGFIS